MNTIHPRAVSDMIQDNTILKVRAGSHAYGTNTPTSDLDIRGIFGADKINILTPFFPVEQSIDMEQDDIVMYELSKYMQLYTGGNPNILEILWTDHEDDVLYISPVGSMLRLYRESLLSSKVAFTFTGYAVAQIKRIKGHAKWINNPKPVDPPKQTNYVSLVHNFTDKKIFKINITDFKDGYRLIPYDGNLYGLYKFDKYSTFDENHLLNTVYDKDDAELFLLPDGSRRTPLFIVKFNKSEYDRENEEWKNYWKWKNNRNETRAALEEAYGFDGKHGMHCVRLMRQGAELLETGKISVRRPDAEELLSIRNGAWTYEYMLEYAEHMDNEIRNVLYPKTALPKTPDIKLAAKVLLDAQEMLWYK